VHYELVRKFWRGRGRKREEEGEGGLDNRKTPSSPHLATHTHTHTLTFIKDPLGPRTKIQDLLRGHLLGLSLVVSLLPTPMVFLTSPL